MSLTEISKYIALILRHKPEAIGITLDEHGWANVDELIAGNYPLLDSENAIQRLLGHLNINTMIYLCFFLYSEGVWPVSFLKHLTK